MSVISIPKKYWLHIDHFDIHSFTYEDVIALQSSPECLLQDFRKNPEFEPTCRAILRAHKPSRRSIRNPFATKINHKPIQKCKQIANDTFKQVSLYLQKRYSI